MSSNHNQIMEHLLNVEGHLGNIDGHLKELNGKVIRNLEDIKDNRQYLNSDNKRLNKIENKISYWLGGAAIVLIVVQVAIQYIFLR